jgi:hypothetical protein
MTTEQVWAVDMQSLDHVVAYGTLKACGLRVN